MARKEHDRRVDSERRARLEAVARQEATAQRRRTALLAGGAALLVLAIVMAVVLASKRDAKATPASPSTTASSSPSASSTTSGSRSPSSSPSTSATSTPPISAAQVVPSAVTGGTAAQPAVAKAPNTSGIDGVVAYNTAGYPAAGTPVAGTLGHDHVSGPVTYSVVPPVGGPHSATLMNAGIYTVPVPSERAVHNLEHGAVWITYRPSLPAADVATLTDSSSGRARSTGRKAARTGSSTSAPGPATPSPARSSSARGATS